MPPGKPILSSTHILPECADCLVAVRGEQLDAHVTCKAYDATRANITVGGKKVQVHINSTTGEFLPAYPVTEKDHMGVVMCSVGNDDVETVQATTKKLYVAGTVVI